MDFKVFDGRLEVSSVETKLDPQNKKIHIYNIDMEGINTNKGYGYCIMEFIESFAISHGAKWISGILGSRDLDHRERQIHFYKKHGFQINGHIVKKTL